MDKTDADKLKRIMIRHTKKQRIGGEVALALPDCDCRTVLLDMSADEKVLYHDAACDDGLPLWLRPTAATWTTTMVMSAARVGMGIVASSWSGFQQRAAFYQRFLGSRPPDRREAARAAFDRMLRETTVSKDGMRRNEPHLDKMTKLVTLLGELRALKAEDADARAIVFTQYDDVQKDVVRALLGSSWEVFEFNKQTAPTKRHKIIKEFQDGLRKNGVPKICVATYATAAVGVTLTAANRVYLMEPSADPATELQAAGRIHRLGQTKEVLIKRFAFRNTIEHAIVDLHEEIKAKRLKAGAGNSDPVVQQVFKKLNLDHEVHMPDPQHTREFTWEQKVVKKHERQPDGSYGPTYGPSIWWKIRRSKCKCCKHLFDISAEKLDKRPPNPTLDKGFHELPYWEKKGLPKPSSTAFLRLSDKLSSSGLSDNRERCESAGRIVDVRRVE